MYIYMYVGMYICNMYIIVSYMSHLSHSRRLLVEDEPGRESEEHVGDVGHGDGQEGALGDGLGGVLQIARQVGAGDNA